jgi:signal peptidase II
MRKFLDAAKAHYLTVGFFAVFTVLDFVSKYLVDKNIRYGQRIDIAGSFVQFTKIYNEGGVFGILQGHKTVFLIISIIVLAVMLGFYAYEKNKTVVFKCAMGLIFSGAVGNILDRLAGKPGVVDFIYIGYRDIRWWAFNVADAAIVVGAVLLMYTFIKSGRSRTE